ncbi:hypothetical protein L596_001411 [Steinernema carpocapsae]|uniref:Uncharacterized protein n=1 Tax=Steinernema carpocapsae TaxID=34508 RepID=A0A4U8UKZ2_STECR|nr:hypothetical protein L596_001411 [Steinernema carpocapsae]
MAPARNKRARSATAASTSAAAASAASAEGEEEQDPNLPFVPVAPPSRDEQKLDIDIWCQDDSITMSVRYTEVSKDEHDNWVGYMVTQENIFDDLWTRVRTVSLHAAFESRFLRSYNDYSYFEAQGLLECEELILCTDYASREKGPCNGVMKNIVEDLFRRLKFQKLSIHGDLKKTLSADSREIKAVFGRLKSVDLSKPIKAYKRAPTPPPKVKGRVGRPRSRKAQNEAALAEVAEAEAARAEASKANAAIPDSAFEQAAKLAAEALGLHVKAKSVPSTSVHAEEDAPETSGISSRTRRSTKRRPLSSSSRNSGDFDVLPDVKLSNEPIVVHLPDQLHNLRNKKT